MVGETEARARVVDQKIKDRRGTFATNPHDLLRFAPQAATWAFESIVMKEATATNDSGSDTPYVTLYASAFSAHLGC